MKAVLFFQSRRGESSEEESNYHGKNETFHDGDEKSKYSYAYKEEGQLLDDYQSSSDNQRVNNQFDEDSDAHKYNYHEDDAVEASEREDDFNHYDYHNNLVFETEQQAYASDESGQHGYNESDYNYGNHNDNQPCTSSASKSTGFSCHCVYHY